MCKIIKLKLTICASQINKVFFFLGEVLLIFDVFVEALRRLCIRIVESVHTVFPGRLHQSIPLCQKFMLGFISVELLQLLLYLKDFFSSFRRGSKFRLLS